MRRLLIAAAVFGLAAGTRADEPAQPNALTPKEIADGWLLLFDGETTFGWCLAGNAKAENGELVLGGPNATKVTLPFTDFDLRAEFRNLGGFGVTNIVLDRDAGKPGQMTTATSVLTGFGKQTAWSTFHLTLMRDPALSSGTASRFKTHVESDKPGYYENHTKYGGDGPLTVRFETTAGNRLALRNVKLRPLGLKPIFNGKDLAGWKTFPGDPKRVKSQFLVTKEGWLNVKDGPGDLQTEGQWADFVLQLECVSNGKHLNSGIFFRCLPDQYQQGYEAQIRNQWQGDDRTKPVDYGTGAIYRRQPARKVVSSDNEWFTMTVLARGNRLMTWVNGYPVADYTDDRPANDNARDGAKTGKGAISIQGHDPTTNLSFRNLRLAELPKPADKK